MANGEGKCSRSGQGSWRMRKCFWNMYPLLLHDVYTDKEQWFVVSLQFRWVCQALKQQCLQSLQIKSAGKQEMSLCNAYESERRVLSFYILLLCLLLLILHSPGPHLSLLSSDASEWSIHTL